MKKFLFVIATISFSSLAVASVQCEQKLEAHFKTLDIKTDEIRRDNDYMKPVTVAEHAHIEEVIKKMMTAAKAKAEDEVEAKKWMKELEKNKVKDTRKNEIIRVCSSIKAFVELGIPAKDIEIKTLSYQNGWSNGMREPLAELIKSEMDDYANAAESSKIEGIDLEPYFCKPNKEETECATEDGRIYKLAGGKVEEESLTVNGSSRSFFKKISDIFSFKREGPPAPVEDRSPTISK